MTAKTASKTAPATTKEAPKGKPAAAKEAPPAKTPEQLEADKAAIAKAKADQKAKDDAAKEAAKAEKEAAKAAAKAEKEAEKEAAAKAKADEKAAKEAEAAKAREAAEAAVAEARKVVEEQQKIVDDLTNQLTEAKAKLADARKAARIPSDGNGASTDALRQRAGTYVKDSEHKTAAGNVSVHCNDETAQKLLGKSLDECYAIAAEVCAPDVTEADLRAKYGHLNLGMQRMNLGNKIRGVLNAK